MEVRREGGNPGTERRMGAKREGRQTGSAIPHCLSGERKRRGREPGARSLPPRAGTGPGARPTRGRGGGGGSVPSPARPGALQPARARFPIFSQWAPGAPPPLRPRPLYLHNDGCPSRHWLLAGGLERDVSARRVMPALWRVVGAGKARAAAAPGEPAPRQRRSSAIAPAGCRPAGRVMAGGRLSARLLAAACLALSLAPGAAGPRDGPGLSRLQRRSLAVDFVVPSLFRAYVRDLLLGPPGRASATGRLLLDCAPLLRAARGGPSQPPPAAPRVHPGGPSAGGRRLRRAKQLVLEVGEGSLRDGCAAGARLEFDLSEPFAGWLRAGDGRLRVRVMPERRGAVPGGERGLSAAIRAARPRLLLHVSAAGEPGAACRALPAPPAGRGFPLRLVLAAQRTDGMGGQEGCLGSAEGFVYSAGVEPGSRKWDPKVEVSLASGEQGQAV